MDLSSAYGLPGLAMIGAIEIVCPMMTNAFSLHYRWAPKQTYPSSNLQKKKMFFSEKRFPYLLPFFFFSFSHGKDKRKMP